VNVGQDLVENDARAAAGVQSTKVSFILDPSLSRKKASIGTRTNCRMLPPFLSGLVILAQFRTQSPVPALVMLAELRVAVPVG